MVNEERRVGRWDWIDKETVLDLMVNIIPMAMLVFFIGLFLLKNPWDFNLSLTVVSHLQLIIPFVATGLLTYFAAKAVARDDQSGDVD